MESKAELKYQCQCIYKNSTPSAFSHTVACWEYNKGFKAGYHQREIDPLDKEDRCEKCYEQGIKEVVDWIEKNKIEVPTLYNIEINYHEWQFKKNAWGIKEENNGNNK
jgi:hypothetical protein